MFDLSEFRLTHTLVLNALLFWTCRRIVRISTAASDPVDEATDLILWFYALASGLVLGLGAVGLLNRGALSAAVIALTVLVWAISRRAPRLVAAPAQAQSVSGSACRTALPAVSRRGIAELNPPMIIAVLAGSVVAGCLWISRTSPAPATDTLIYHLTLPARWIQDGKLSTIPLWFHNPANSYSPLQASCLFAWFMVPMGNDLVARFGQVPFLLLCGLCLYRLLRQADLMPTAAAAIAAACCLCRAFLAESLHAKDDVIVAGCFLAAVCSLADEGPGSVRNALRLGLSLGLMLATKYTAILLLPLFMVLGVLKLRPRVSIRQMLCAAIPIVLLAGPWYLRNLIQAGSPIYPVELRIGSWPVLSGVFATTVDPADRSPVALIHVITGTSRYTLPPRLMLLLVFLWGIAGVVSWRRLKRPVFLAAIAAPPLLLAVFYEVSPFREVRFLFPMISMMFVACGIGITRLSGPPWVRSGAAILLLSVCIATAVPSRTLADTLVLALGFAVILLSVWIAARWACRRGPAVTRPLMGIVGLGAAAAVYVYWDNYTAACREDYRLIWSMAYAESGLGPAWAWIDRNAAPGDEIACTGTPMTYPLMGFDLSRRAVYLPICAGIDDFGRLPRIPERLSGRQIVARTVQSYRNRPDRDHWLSELGKRKVRFLLTTCAADEPPPIEQQWADGLPHLQRTFSNRRTTVYEVR